MNALLSKIEILRITAASADRAGMYSLAFELNREINALYSKPIPGFPGYRATLDGTIIGKQGHVLSNWRGTDHGRDKYKRVGPMINGVRVRVDVHVLVALAFHGERPEGWEIHHINFDRDDNRPENLEYLPHDKHVGKHKDRAMAVREQGQDF